MANNITLNPGTGGEDLATIDDGTAHFQRGYDFYLDVASGGLTGHSTTNKFGRNPAIDTATVPETIWDVGGVYVPPTAARVHALTSDDPADDVGGTGALTVTVYGLDANWDEQFETVTMTGAVGANTVGSYIRLHRMVVATTGTGHVNAGAIAATAAVDATVSATILAGKGQTLMAFWTVPNGKTAYITGYYASIQRTISAVAEIELIVHANAASQPVHQIKHTNAIDGAGTSYMRHDFRPYLKVEQKQDISLEASYVSTNSTILSGGFDLILVAN